MSSCHIRLADFAVACDKCGWSIVDTAANTINGNSNRDGSAAAEIAPFDPGEDPPIVIVKNVAKAAPPPPPEDRSTDDLLPAEITGDRANYLYQRGTCFYELEKYDQALADFKKACQLRPNHAGTWIWSAATSARNEQWSEAITGLRKASAIRPSAAQQYRELGKPVAEKAIKFFDRQQQRGGAQPSLFRQRGLLYHFLGGHEQAVINYSQALDADPKHHETLVRRGRVYASLGDHVAAIKDFSKVIHIDQANHSARYARALANCQAEKWELAGKDFRKILRITPNDSAIKKVLQWLENREKPRPSFLEQPKTFHRPTRPLAICSGVEIVESSRKWDIDPPYDWWIVRSADRKEYGPVQGGILQTWINDGRGATGMKLLRADWSKWKRAEKLFPEISSVASQPKVTNEFPGIVTRGPRPAAQASDANDG